MARIVAAARDVGYHKKTSSKALCFRNVLVLSQIGDVGLDGGYMTGLTQTAVGLDTAIHFYHCHAGECEMILHPYSMPHVLRSGCADGIIFLHRWPLRVVETLARTCPAVSVVHEYEGLDVIGVDEPKAMEEIVAHLVETGCHRIGFFGHCPEVSWAKNRFAAFSGAMAAVGLGMGQGPVIAVPLPQVLSEVEFYNHDAMSHVRMATLAGVNAWVCPSEMTARSLLAFLRQAGFSVPADVSVVGFHTSSSIGRYEDRLTSTKAEAFEMGRAALLRLLQRIERVPCPARKLLLPCPLVKGATTRDTSVHKAFTDGFSQTKTITRSATFTM